MASSELAERLRRLREERGMNLRATARALKISEASVSAWENAKSLPPVRRLDEYAKLFGHPEGSLPATSTDWTPAQQESYRRLAKSLSDLRARAVREQNAGPTHPWQFPVGDPITIVCSELSEERRRKIGYSDPRKPDFVESYQYADLDSLVELYGDVKALNPSSSVLRVVPSKLNIENRGAHLIVLGGVDFNSLTKSFLDEGSMPVRQFARPRDEDVGGFAVGAADNPQTFSPVVVERDGRDALKEDVAFFLRADNPYNQERTLTICNGMYARGSFGVVRALTDPQIRDRNTEYLYEQFKGKKTYCILCRVKVVAGEIVTPDWKLDSVRLYRWPED